MSAVTTSPRPRFRELSGSRIDEAGYLVAPCPACRSGTASMDSANIIECSAGCTHALVTKALFDPELARVSRAGTTLKAADTPDTSRNARSGGQSAGVRADDTPAPADTPSPFTVLDTSTMLATEPPPVRWLIDGVVERGSLTLLAGREKEGKSLLTQALAACVASGGGEIAGITCKPGKVLLVDAENGGRVLHRRVRGLGLASEHSDQLVIAEARGADLRHHLSHLDALLREHEPDLLIVDSFRSTWAGEENSSGEVAAVLDPVRNLVRDRDVATILIHHAGKLGGYRGSTGIGAAVENVLELVRLQDDDDRRRRRLRNAACRYAQEAPDLWLRIEGDVARNLVLVEPAEPFDGRREDEEPQRGTPVQDQLVDRVRGVLKIEPQTQATIARALGRDARDQSVRRVLKALAASGDASKSAAGWSSVSRGVATPGDTRDHVVVPLRRPANALTADCDDSEGGAS